MITLNAIFKREALVEWFTILGFLFTLVGCALFGIMIASYYLHLTPPAWLSPPADTTNIGIYWYLCIMCAIASGVYYIMFMRPFSGRRINLRIAAS